MLLEAKLDTPWQAPEGMGKYLEGTDVVDLDSNTIRRTTKEVISDSRTPKEAAVSIFYFIRDEIKFALTPQLEKASTVVERRTGYCVSKATAMVAMARVANIPARYHFASIKKEATRGLMGSMGYRFMPKVIPTHCWVNLYLNGKWIGVEFTYDKKLLEVQKEKKMGIYEKGIELAVDWDGEHDLLIPPEFLVEDLGVYESPEAVVKREVLWPLWEYLQNRNLGKIRGKLKSERARNL